MSQTQVNRAEEQVESSSFDQIKADFENIQATPLTRTVILKYKSCCGCGCSTVDLRREVPHDSHLQNGDYADDVEDNDEIL